jgi:type IV secretion system protein VirB10
MKNDNRRDENENQEEYYDESEVQDTQNEEFIETSDYEDKSKKKKKIALVSGILLFAVMALFWIFSGEKKDETAKQTINFADEFANVSKKKQDESLDIVAPTIKNSFDMNDIKKPEAQAITQQQLEIKIPEQPKIEQIQQIEQIPTPKEIEIQKPPVEEKNPVEAALPLLLGIEEKKELPPLITGENETTQKTNGQDNQGEDYRARKRYANVLLMGGESNNQENPEEAKKQEFIDLITGRTNKIHTKPSAFAKITDSYVGMKDRMILSGKIIDIVLESRISTASKEGGIIRAIVSSDVYSESGNNILIPAGSRVIGDYSNSKKSENKRTAYRVEVGLSRIIRPDGVDILLGGMPITDPLGGKGITPDKVISGVGKSIINSVLIGALSLGAFYAGKSVDDSFTDKKQPIIINNFGTDGTLNNTKETSSNDEANSVIKDIVDNVTENLKNTIGDGKDIEPVFIINQGKKLSILVDKDIVFTDENAFVFFPGELTSLLKNCCKNY